MTRLRTADTSRPGWSRILSGDTATIVDERGRPVAAQERARVEALVIPPAWTDVWIAPHPNAHIQAVGVDAAGRRQYLYHEAWSARKAREKFDHVLELAERLPSARRQVTRDLRADPGSRERALGAAFRLLDTAFLRVGNDRYAALYGSRGLTTLLCGDARVSDDTVLLRFIGKSGVPWESATTDADLAHVVRSLKARGPDERLLAWRADGDTWAPVGANAVNEYVRARTHGDFTGKDFRTLHGTIEAARALARAGLRDSRTARDRAVREAIADVAALLGNTPAVARSSYVDPRVIDRYQDGHLLRLSGMPERALIELIRG